jgi:hypothetical protein
MKTTKTPTAANIKTEGQFIYSADTFARIYTELYRLWNVCDYINDNALKEVDAINTLLRSLETRFFADTFPGEEFAREYVTNATNAFVDNLIDDNEFYNLFNDEEV